MSIINFRRCPCCNESVEATRLTFCEACSETLSEAGEHPVGCTCTDCQTYVRVERALYGEGLSIADVAGL